MISGALDKVLDKTLVGYTKLGFLARKSAWSGDLPRLDGKVVVVTGSSGGIGRAASLRLAELGATVALVGRDQVRTELVRAQIEAAGGNARGFIADLGLMKEVRVLASELVAAFGRVDVLVNNVGVMYPERKLTSEGIEATLATNLLGHFVLTEALLEAISGRIINVTSGGMYSQRIAPDDLQLERTPYSPTGAYARTKRGQVILTELWAERFRERGIIVHSMHPGWADTPGVRASLPKFRNLTKPFLRDEGQAADTIVWLAASDDALRSSGKFWHDRIARPTHRLSSTRETPEERELFWTELERLAAET